MKGTLAVLALAASATCGPKPDLLPIDVLRLDGGSADGGAIDAGSPCEVCLAWGEAEIMGPLPLGLEELSGLAASRAMPGVIYAHNDSGDRPRVLVMTEFGQLLAELRLSGADAVDWEDMALGPCGGGVTCLFLADIGDNLRKRGIYTVYRAREPAVSPALLRQASIELEVAFERLPFVYPGNARHNAETLLVHPITGDVYVVTKEPSPGSHSRVFKFPRPFTPAEVATLVPVGPVSVPTVEDLQVTGGAISPCGDAVLLRMYNRTVELRAVDGGFESAFGAEPREVPTALDEPQGEAITWARDGRGFFTASEGTGQSLHRIRCAP